MKKALRWENIFGWLFIWVGANIFQHSPTEEVYSFLLSWHFWVTMVSFVIAKEIWIGGTKGSE